jgi:hemolysin activation/secretion protein
MTATRAPGLLLCLTLLSAPLDTNAQPLSLPLKRPSQETLELPTFEPSEQTAPLQLPPLESLPPEVTLADQVRVYAREIRITGNTVFSREELDSLIEPYEGREITAGELQELRYALTLHYVSHGYINSGAVIPDQTVEDGIITLEIIEGQLDNVMVSGNDRLHADYISDRIMRGAGPPLNIAKLGEKLQILQQNPRFEQLNATLQPGARPGESNLDVRVQEAQPYHLWVGYDNHQPPSVGGEEARVWGEHLNLTGRGDTLQFEYDKAEGLDDWSIGYSIPLNAADTTLRLYYDNIDSKVVEDPFEALDIKSDEDTFSLTLAQPFYLSVNRTLTLGLSLDLRESTTYVLGERFPFTTGTDDGRTKLSVLRFSQEWLDRGRNRVLAARSLISNGIDAFDATVNGEPRDGKFVSWLGQFQVAQRIGESESQIIFRTYAQAANGGLPPMEQITIGGAESVRGYRENRLVADTGFVASLEGRIPLFTSSKGDLHLQVAPFLDYGNVNNRYGEDPDPDHIASAGLSLLGTAYKRIDFGLIYGYAFQDFDDPDNNIQDDGISFTISLRLL